MKDWRIIEVEGSRRASLNLAIEEAIFHRKSRLNTSTIVRFWRNLNSVIVGYSQSVKAEVNLEFCRNNGVDIVRRLTGGGAVYHDLGNLNYSIVIDVDHPHVKGIDITQSYQKLCSGIIEGLKSFGINPVFDPPSNIILNGKKISGNSQCRKKSIILHHGTLLVNTDLDFLNKALCAPRCRRTTGVTSVRRIVTRLSDEIVCYKSIDNVKQVLIKGFEKAFSAVFSYDSLHLDEKKLALNLYANKYSQNDWNFWR